MPTRWANVTLVFSNVMTRAKHTSSEHFWRVFDRGKPLTQLWVRGMVAQMTQEMRLRSSSMAPRYSIEEAAAHSGLSVSAIDLCCQSGVIKPFEHDRILQFSTKDILTLKVVYVHLLNRRMSTLLELCSAKLGIDLGQIEHASADGKGRYTELVDLILTRVPYQNSGHGESAATRNLFGASKNGQATEN